MGDAASPRVTRSATASASRSYRSPGACTRSLGWAPMACTGPADRIPPLRFEGTADLAGAVVFGAVAPPFRDDVFVAARRDGRLDVWWRAMALSYSGQGMR